MVRRSTAENAFPRHLARATTLVSALLLADATQAADPSYLRLVDRLDRQEDGYCLDVVGSGGAFRLDMPLVAHNCKPGGAPDGLVVFTEDGRMAFPAFDACVTTMTVAQTALPGASVMLKPCGWRAPFAPAERAQIFEHRGDGRLALADADLCLEVGPEAAATFSPVHRWRTVYLAPCAAPDRARQRWEFTAPYP